MKKSQARWIPAVAVPAVVIAAAVAVPQMADASVKLPHKDAAQITSLAMKSSGASFSGTISETANLGLPDVSSLGGGSSSGGLSDVVSQLTGTHKAKVYVDGTKASRVQTLDNLAERDVVRNGDSVWAYDSQKKEATHLTLPDHGSASSDSSTFKQPMSGAAQTPADLSKAILAKVGAVSTVTTSDNVMVAGQKAYEIVVTPKDASTLVGSVTMAVDAKTGVPLKATVVAKGQKAAAFSVQFDSIKYQTPSASTFAFTAPKGAKVTELKAPAHPKAGPLTQQSATDKAEWAKARPTVAGSGWSTVVGAALPKGSASATGDQSGLLDQVLTKVDGGRVLQTALVSVYLTDDGHVWVGAVPAADLESAAASAPTK